MKKISITIMLTVMLFAVGAEAAQIVGDMEAERSRKILRDLNIMEGVLEERIAQTGDDDIKFKFSVDAVYFDGIGVIFNVGSFYSSSIQLENWIWTDGDSLHIEIPNIDVRIPDINIYTGGDKSGKRIFVKRHGDKELSEEEKAELEKEMKELKAEQEELNRELDKMKQGLEEQRITMMKRKEAGKKEYEETRRILQKIAEDYYISTISGIRNLEKRDRVILNIKLPVLPFADPDKNGSLNFSVDYEDIRDFRREKLSEAAFRKKISENANIDAGLQKDIDAFSEIMWNLAVEDPNWMFTSRVTEFYLQDLGVIYNFNAYMVEKTLRNLKALAKDLHRDRDKDESAMAELEKEQEKRREKLIESVLETSGTYVNVLDDLPEGENIICLFEMSDSHYGLDDASLMIKMKKSDLLDFYREKIDSRDLQKKVEISYTPQLR